MAAEQLALRISAQDLTGSAFASVQRNVAATGRQISEMAAGTVRDVKQMAGGFIQFGQSLASGSVTGAVMGLFSVIVDGLRAASVQMALTTAGISILIGAVALLANKWIKAEESMAEASKKKADDVAKYNADMEKAEQDRIGRLRDLNKKYNEMTLDGRIKNIEREKAIAMKTAEEAAKGSALTYFERTRQYMSEYPAYRAKFIQNAVDKAAAIYDKQIADEKAKFQQASTNRLVDAEKERQELIAGVIDENNKWVAAEREKQQKLKDEREKARQDEMIAADNAYNTRIMLAKKEAEERMAIERQVAEQKQLMLNMGLLALQQGTSLASSIQQIQLNKTGAISRRTFNLMRGMSAAEAGMSGATAAVNAMSWGLKYGGPAAPALIAGMITLIGATTGAKLAAIASQKMPSFQTSTTMTRRAPGPSTRAIPAIIHGGETVTRKGGAPQIIIQGNLYNEEQTMRALDEGMRNFYQRTGRSW
jgi:hypothetical protein